MEKMTIHRGLAELKLIDSKIEKQILQFEGLGIKQKDKPVKTNTVVLSQDDFENKVKSSYDSIMSLIKRKSEIKAAIVAINTETLVKINNMEMSIADAITHKSNISLIKQFIAKMKSNHSQIIGALNNNQNVTDTNLQKLLEASFGKDNTKVSKEDVDNISKPFLDNNTWTLVDPLKLSEKIEKLDKEVSNFEMEVDAVLSEINAVTFIEI